MKLSNMPMTVAIPPHVGVNPYRFNPIAHAISHTPARNRMNRAIRPPSRFAPLAGTEFYACTGTGSTDGGRGRASTGPPTIDGDSPGGRVALTLSRPGALSGGRFGRSNNWDDLPAGL